MKVKHSVLMAGSLLALLSTTGCKREASGQVVAVVNGDEITRQEIDAELNGKSLPQNVDTKRAQQLLLQSVVNRHLLAGAARTDGIDKDQEYLLKQKRTDDALLIELLGSRTARTFRVPDNAAIDKYVAAHPQIFGQRTVYQLDQIMFAPPTDANTLKALKDDHSMDAVASRLSSLGIKFARGNGQLDSAMMEPAVLSHIKALPPTEPFVLPRPGALTVNVITGSTAAPFSPEDARPIAVQLMRKEAVDNSLKARLKAAKAEAKIDYQPGYAPSPDVLKSTGL